MFYRTLTILCVLICAPNSAPAQEYDLQNVARFDILPGYPSQKGHIIAARIQLRDKWKTYWRAPGGNGIPPLFDWKGSKNVRAITFHWPEPNIFNDEAGRTLGYKTELILPIDITPQNAGQPILLKGEVTFGVCEDICMPVLAKFELNVPETHSQNHEVIRAAMARLPKTAKAAGIHSVKCQIKPISGGFQLTAKMRTRASLPADTFTVFELPHPEAWIEQYHTSIRGTKLIASANLYTYGDTPLILDRRKITMTLLGGKHAIEVRGCPS